MNSETIIAATRYRLKEWVEQIRDCQNRPAVMSVADWRTSHGITKANYYYRLSSSASMTTCTKRCTDIMSNRRTRPQCG